MVNHQDLSGTELRRKFKEGQIQFGGNARLKIYGTLACASGKRMKRENRVFFLSEGEAREHNFRPCGHCMRREYKIWKNGIV